MLKSDKESASLSAREGVKLLFGQCPFEYGFLAALAALGLPWLLTVLSLCCIQSLLAFQTKQKPHKTDGGHEKTSPDQQKDKDKDIQRTPSKSDLLDS